MLVKSFLKMETIRRTTLKYKCVPTSPSVSLAYTCSAGGLVWDMLEQINSKQDVPFSGISLSENKIEGVVQNG